MPASQPANFNLQEFTDAGQLLVGGRLYTYAYGTTAQKTAYTDPDGTVPHTYTLDGAGGQYIALNARGELPAPLYLVDGSYDVALKRADGSTVWTRKADGVDNSAKSGLAALVASLAASAGSSLIGFIQAGAGVVKRTVQDELRERVSVTQFGADPAGVKDSTAAFAAALAAADEVIMPAGTYKLTAGLSLARATGASKLRTAGAVTLMMSGLGAGDDAITFVGYNYKAATIDGDLTVDMQWTGRDGLKVFAGDAPRAVGVKFKNVPRDCLQFFTVDTNWVENGFFQRVSGENIGRHFLAAYTGGVSGAFINEMVFQQCEVRGCSQKYAGGTAVFASAGGVEGMGAKMSEWTFIDCNYDAQRGKAIAAGFDIDPSPVHLAFNDTGSGKGSIYESWRFMGGGWETTSGGYLQTQGLFYSQPGSGAQQNVCRGWHITGITPGGWGNASFTGIFDDAVDHNKQFGTLKSPFISQGWIETSINPSTATNIDISLPFVHVPVVGRVAAMDVFELTLFYQQFPAAGFGAYRSRLYVIYDLNGTDQYSFHEDNERAAMGGFFTVTSMQLLNATGGTTVNLANPPKKVRIGVLTDISWGSAGGDPYMQVILKHVGRSHREFASQFN